MTIRTFINVVIWQKSISMQHQWWWSWDRYSIMWWYITHIIPYGFFLTFMKKNEKFSKFWDFDSFLFFKTWGSIAPPGSALCMPCSYVPLVLTQSNLRFSKLRTLQTLEKRKSNFSPEDELNCKFAPLQNMPKMCLNLEKMNSNTFTLFFF